MQIKPKETVMKLARLLLGEYAAYKIYRQSAITVLPDSADASRKFRIERIDESALEASPDPLIREQLWYLGSESQGYACFCGDRIVAVCFYWFGQRYLERNFWPLKEGEAKLVQVIALPEMRGRGIATALVAQSCQQMMQQQFSRLYARIWHSNQPSLRAFERAGWKQIAMVLEINPLRQKQPLRLRFSAKRTKAPS